MTRAKQQPGSLANIPDAVLEQAFNWAVVLGSGISRDADHDAFAAWLDSDPLHRMAWERVQLVEQEFVTPSLDAAVGRSALDKVDAGRRNKRRWTAGTGGLLTMLLAIVLMFNDPFHWQADYRTATGEQLRLELPRGGTVWLNSHSVVDIETEDAHTLVRLHRGEVLIDSSTATAPTKPRVVTEHGRFAPIGTRFVVTRRDRVSELAVIKGRVRAQAEAGATSDSITAGRRWWIDETGAGPLPATGLEPGAWVDGVIEADNAPLSAVLDALAGYRYGWLQYESDIAALRVTGVFRLDDTDGALKALAATLPIRIEHTTPFWVRVTHNTSR